MRRATDNDLDAVLELESLCFDDPWPDESIAEELTDDPRRLPLVVEVEGEVRGVALVWAVADELHIVSLGVHPEYRRRGLATLLLEAIAGSAPARGASVMTLEVRERNAAAIAFYRRHGFLEVTRRPRYYPDTREDAIVMLRPLGPGSTSADPFDAL